MAGQSASFLRMDWTANGSLATVAWRADWRTIAMTVHRSCNGRLQRTLYIDLYDPHNPHYDPYSFTFPLHAFAACPHQPAAAVAYKFECSTRVALMDLATGANTLLQHPHRKASRYCCGIRDSCTYDLVWPPQGRHLAVREATLMPKQKLDWFIFEVPSGE